MLYCPDCRSEYLDGIVDCADCAVPLVAALPPPPAAEAPRPVFATLSYGHAFGFRAFLESFGIPARIQNEHSWNHVAGVPSLAIPLVVEVDGSDLPDARAALDEWLRPVEAPAGSEPGTEPTASPWAAGLAAAAFLIGLDADRRAGTPSAPVLAVLAWLSLQTPILFRLGPASFRLLAGGFAYGALAALAMVVALPEEVRSLYREGQRVIDRQFLFTGPVEELLKVLGPLILAGLLPGLRGRRDLLAVLAGASAVGFATLENACYLSAGVGREAAELFVQRSGSLLHLALSVYVVSGPAPFPIGRLLAAAAVHGTWNALAYSGYPWGTLILLWGVVVYLVGRIAETDVRSPAAAPLPASLDTQ